jgi:pilus assembly protein CpaD
MASFSNDGRRTEMTTTRPRTDRRLGLWLATRIPCAILAAAALASCKTTETTDTVPYAYDYRERHPIRLQEGVRTVEIFVGRRRAGLMSAQRRNVEGFAHEWHREASGGIEIRVPYATDNERASRDTVSEIEGILIASGVPRTGIVARPAHPATRAELMPIVLSYPRIAAVAGPCGHWPNDLGPGAGIGYDTNEPYWNLGCSMQRNLAAMVEDPSDLVQPRAETPVYTARRSVVLDHYRKGEDPSTQYHDVDKAKISDVGK